MIDAYDPLAFFYERYWGGPFHEHALAALDLLFLHRVPAGSRILDACCGAGHLAAQLAERGYRVVGVDRSRGMLEAAHRRRPDLALVHADVCALPLDGGCAGALATFDALNHVTDPAALAPLFAGARRALDAGAPFVFDVLLEEAYRDAWRGTAAHVGDDHACIVRGGFDATTRAARTELTLFRSRGGGWERSDVVVHQRCHGLDELERAARDAGFESFEHRDARRDLGLDGPFAIGRAWCLCR